MRFGSASSWSIASHAAAIGGRAPVPEGLKERLDMRLAPLTRQLTYSFLFKPSNLNVWDGLVTQNTSLPWRALWWAGGTKLTNRMTGMFSAADPEAITLCRRRIQAEMTRIDASGTVR